MTGDPASAPARRRGGPPVLFAALGIGSLALAALLIAAQVLGLGTGGSARATMAPTGQSAALTHDLVIKALQTASFQVQDPLSDYRPAENATLSVVPRRLLQVIVPSEPAGEYVVIYELPTAGEADRVGREFLAYLGGGTGAIQYPADSRFVLRRMGPTLVFFPWSPQASPDPGVPVLAAVLEGLGEPIRP